MASPGDDILIQYDWSYWTDVTEDDRVREKMRVYCDNLQSPVERQLDEQVVAAAEVAQAAEQAHRQEA